MRAKSIELAIAPPTHAFPLAPAPANPQTARPMPDLSSQPIAPLPAGAWRPDALATALQTAGLRPMQARDAAKMWVNAYHRDGLDADAALAFLPPVQAVRLRPLLLADRPLTQVEEVVARDHTRRLLWRTHDALVIESVIIPADNSQRVTLCVSSQVGCGRRCAFCETGRLGLVRNLGVDEIVGQFRLANRIWNGVRGALPAISNIVFMGMGEPLDNLDNVIDAIAVLTHDWSYGLSARKISVSTVGVAQKFAAFFARTNANLALSLNAPDDARRSELMPVNQRVPMADLKTALLATLPKNRSVLVEYILFAGLNDQPADAELLRTWLDGVPARLNLIPANPGPDPRLQSPTKEAVWAFQKQLLDAGVRVMVRYPHGRDVGGACGQLAGAHRQKRGEAEVTHG
jgi:23S rRNA (adenine2503-C2)-methyltransferase